MAERPQNRHLKPPWPKGTSGYAGRGKPPGRPPGPRGTKITDYLLELLDEQDIKGKTNSERIARAVLAKAAKGDLHAVSHVTDRTEGKTPTRVEMTGADGGPLEFADARSRLLGRLAARKPRVDPADPQ